MGIRCGSAIPVGTPEGHYTSVPVLTKEGIMQKHGLTLQAFGKIQGELNQQKLRDILFHYPDGPRYDIALYLIAYSR